MLPWLRPLVTPLLGTHRLILLASLVFTLLYNHGFFRNLHDVYGDTMHSILFMVALGLLVFAIHVLLLSVLCFRYTTKAVLTFLCFGGAAASYYMDRFNIVVDSTMLTNVFQTDTREVRDLLTLALVVQLLVLGLLPSIWVWRVRIHYSP